MHPLTWAFKWFNHKAKFQGKINGITLEQMNQYHWQYGWTRSRTEDKKVVFIHKCLPNIPEHQLQLQEKNIRDENYHYHRLAITSPPVLKAYNSQMGGLDRHDRLVGHHQISLSSKRGYIKVFFLILFKTAGKPKVSGEQQMKGGIRSHGSKNASFYLCRYIYFKKTKPGF